MSTETLVQAIVREYLEALALAKQFTEIAVERRAEITAMIPAGDTVEIEPGLGIAVGPPRRQFNKQLAARTLTAEQYRSICEAVPSAVLARAKLPAQVMDSITAPTGDVIVRILRP